MSDTARTVRSTPAAGALRDLALMVFYHSAGYGAAAPLVPLFAAGMGAGPAMVGLVVAVSEFFPIFLALPVGVLTDRLGPRRLLIAGAAGMVASSAVRTLASDLGLLVLSQVLLGVTSLAVWLCGQSFVARVVRPEERAQQFGTWIVAISLGNLVGPVAGGVVADLALAAGTSQDAAYRVVFAAGGLVGVLGVWHAWRLPDPPPADQRSLSLRDTLGEAAGLLRRRGVVLGSLTSFSLILSGGIRRSFLPLYLAGLQMSPTAIGVLFAAPSLAAVAVRPFLASLVRWAGELGLLRRALVLTTVAWACVPWLETAVPLFLALAGTGLGHGAGLPVTMVLTVSDAPAYEHGTALGIRQMANRVADTVSPAAFGLAAGLLGLAASFYLAAAFAAGGLAAMGLLLRKGPSGATPVGPQAGARRA